MWGAPSAQVGERGRARIRVHQEHLSEPLTLAHGGQQADDLLDLTRVWIDYVPDAQGSQGVIEVQPSL